jgi:NAD(P)-dependent dehydrogenase (short-subunit alcohol dehydrogenase family)
LSPERPLDGRVALVTGAASGIGRAACLRLARAGARVAATDVDPGGESVAAGIVASGGVSTFRALDVRDEAAWVATVAEVVQAWGRLDVLVGCAGIALAHPVTETSLEEWRQVLSVNLDGVFLGTKHVLAAMRRLGHGGSIVHVASASGLVGSAGASAYCASKGGVRLFTKAVALECAREGIRVNSIHPGGVRTPIWERSEGWPDLVARSGGTEEAYRAIASTTPAGRLAEPEEIAELVLFLASDSSRFMTGSEVAIDGGYTAQ